MDTLSRLKRFRPALAPELLLQNDFFTLYPPDGGGGFIMLQELGSVEDAAIARHIMAEDGLADFGTLPELDYHKFEFWTTIERGCWLNRLYFAAPLARVARLNNDRKLARLVLDTILYFHRTQQPPADAVAAQELEKEITRRRNVEYNQGIGDRSRPVPYQWYDFQPAGRIVNVLHALWFLSELDCITEAEAEELTAMIDGHARIIDWQEAVLPAKPGNHQALRGLALLYAGTFLDNWQYLETGIRLADYHIQNDFCSDGLLHEASPTYHCFETWIARDCCYLARLYDFPLQMASFAMLSQAAAAAAMICRPDGRAVVLNDGCNLTLATFLRTLPRTAEAMAEHMLLPVNRIATWRHAAWFLLFDASPFTGQFSHYHSGKNAPTLWYRGLPFLVDSGCCNYDLPDFAGWFKHSFAHSSLLVDGQSDGTLRGTYEWLAYAETRLSDWQDGVLTGALRSSVPAWHGVEWQRTLRTAAEGVTLKDRVTAGKMHDYEFFFVLHPDVTVKLEEHKAVLSNSQVKLHLRFDSATPVKLNILPGKYCDGAEIRESRRIRVAVNGTNVELTTTVKPV